jgi:beta-lactamase class A
MILPYGAGAILLSLLLMSGCVSRNEAGADLQTSINRLLNGAPGIVYVNAKNLVTGEEFERNADTPVRTASTIKLPIMVACFRAVGEGIARWDEPIAITEDTRVSGSGVIREFADGTVLTLRDLMHVMIVISDNTATNMILKRLGADYVKDTMQQLGFEQTRSMRRVRGDGTQLKDAVGWSREGEKEENKRFGIGRSTAREMGRLLEMLEDGKVISPEASAEMLGVLKRQQLMNGIGRRWVDQGDVSVASKSGALDTLRSDVGIVYHPKGRLVVAITIEELPGPDYSADNPGNRLISDLTGVLLEEMVIRASTK